MYDDGSVSVDTTNDFDGGIRVASTVYEAVLAHAVEQGVISVKVYNLIRGAAMDSIEQARTSTDGYDEIEVEFVPEKAAKLLQ
jgi:hypothetical protein